MNHEKLPKGYEKIGIIDLDSKHSPEKRRVSLIALVLALLLALLGYLIQPFDETVQALFSKVWVLMALLAVLFAWMVLREVVQGAAMRLLSGEAFSRANENVNVGNIRELAGTQKFYILRWSADGVEQANHYISGYPPYKAETLLAWADKIEKL